MDKYDRFLPIGSVVEVENYSEPYMIVKKGIDKDSYLGVKIPYGYESEEEMIKFKIDEVKGILFIGYINKEIEENRQKMNFRRLVGDKTNE